MAHATPIARFNPPRGHAITRAMPPAPRQPAILQVLPALGTGGVERGTLEMVAAIAGAGGRALVASAGGPLVPMVAKAGGQHITLPLATKSPLGIWRNAQRLRALIRAEQVHLVHARSRAPAWSAALATSGRTPLVTTWHGSYRENLPLKRRYNAVMASGARVIAISHHIAALIAARHPDAAPRLRVIPRGVDPALFDPAIVHPDRLVRLAQAWRLPDGAPVVLLPARLTAWKGHKLAIEALAGLPGTAILVLAGADQGRTAYARALADLALARGVGDRVRIVGDCADMPAAFKLADIALNVSTVPEAFGRTVIEAQAMACPIIAANHGGAAETVRDGETGLLIPPNDPAALQAAMAALLAWPEADRLALGAAARAHVSAHYTTAAMQRATLDVYNEVLDGGEAHEV